VPKKWQEYINTYSLRADNTKSETETIKLIKKILITIIINIILISSIVIVCSKFLLPALEKTITGILPESITLVIGLLFAAPFLWALIFKNPDNISNAELIKNEQYNRRELLVVEISRLILGIICIGYLADECFGTKIALFAVVPVSFFLLIIFRKYLSRFYKLLERRFMLNLHGREIAAAEKDAPMSNLKHRLHARNPNLSDWDVHLTDLQTPQHAKYIGRTLKELQWREKFNINVIYLKRGEHITYSPGPNVKIMPFDNIGIIASDEILEKFKPEFFKEQTHEIYDIEVEDIVVEKIYIYENSNLLHKTIRNSKIRETTGGMVVAIERDDNRILTPSPDIIFKESDIVWVVGERKRLKKLY
jgi:CPA2 family monovalent cation:H+ antiporter-2